MRTVVVTNKQALLVQLALVDDSGVEITLQQKDGGQCVYRFPVGWGNETVCVRVRPGEARSSKLIYEDEKAPDGRVLRSFRNRTLLEAVAWRRKQICQIVAKVKRTKATVLFG